MTKTPPVPHHHAIRVGQAGGKLGARVEPPVPIGVGEQGDDAFRLRRGLAFEGVGIAAVLGHIHPPAIVERDGHRTLDERLGGDEIDPVARFDDEPRERR